MTNCLLKKKKKHSKKSAYLSKMHSKQKSIKSSLKNKKEKTSLQVYKQNYLKYANKGKRESKVVPGSIVFLKRPPIKVDASEQRQKLLPIFGNPHLCVERYPNNTVTLKDLVSNDYSKVPVHISKLKFIANFDPVTFYANERCYDKAFEQEDIPVD